MHEERRMGFGLNNKMNISIYSISASGKDGPSCGQKRRFSGPKLKKALDKFVYY